MSLTTCCGWQYTARGLKLHRRWRHAGEPPVKRTKLSPKDLRRELMRSRMEIARLKRRIQRGAAR